MSAHATAQVLVDYEAALARVVLAAAVESLPALGRAPGRGFVAAVLTGSLRKDVVGSEAYRLVSFGVLSHLRMADVVAILDKLIAADLLARAPTKGGLVCSAAGRGLLERGTRVGLAGPVGLIPGVVNARALDLAIRSGLIDALRRFRAERARGEDVAEYLVFSESTLRGLAAARPMSESELERVPGLGPKRIAAYGGELLRILAEHAPIVARLAATEPTPTLESVVLD